MDTQETDFFMGPPNLNKLEGICEEEKNHFMEADFQLLYDRGSLDQP